MQRTFNYSPLASPDFEVNSTFNVVIAYEDFETGKRAKRVYDFLSAHLTQDCEFINQMWKFDVLSIIKLREMAAKDAAAADIVIIACHGTDLPIDVKVWIELWIGQENPPLALVALFDSDLDQSNSSVREYLSEVAKRGNMEFFIQPDSEIPRNSESVGLFAQRDHSSDRTLSAIAGMVQRETTFPRWGINE